MSYRPRQLAYKVTKPEDRIRNMKDVVRVYGEKKLSDNSFFHPTNCRCEACEPRQV
jgi:hypothetical protein